MRTPTLGKTIPTLGKTIKIRHSKKTLCTCIYSKGRKMGGNPSRPNWQLTDEKNVKFSLKVNAVSGNEVKHVLVKRIVLNALYVLGLKKNDLQINSLYCFTQTRFSIFQ